MKRLLCIGGLVLCAASATAALAVSDFEREFAQHWEQGTLFHYDTAKRFSDLGWSARYRDAVASLPEGSVEGLALEITLKREEPPTIRKPLAVDFWLINRSERDIALPVRGSCKTVHAAQVVVVDPEGRSHDWIGRGLNGGHCFCKQISEVVRAGSRVKLTTTVSNGFLVTTWKPSTFGKYVVLGRYTLPDAPGKTLFSKPFIVDIRPR